MKNNHPEWQVKVHWDRNKCKFGLKGLENTNRAYMLDKLNEDTQREDTIKKELEGIGDSDAFKVFEKRKSTPPG